MEHKNGLESEKTMWERPLDYKATDRPNTSIPLNPRVTEE